MLTIVSILIHDHRVYLHLFDFSSQIFVAFHISILHFFLVLYLNTLFFHANSMFIISNTSSSVLYRKTTTFTYYFLILQPCTHILVTWLFSQILWGFHIYYLAPTKNHFDFSFYAFYLILFWGGLLN